jgi:hypothetical protein
MVAVFVSMAAVLLGMRGGWPLGKNSIPPNHHYDHADMLPR